MNEKELLELLAEDAPLPPADYPLTTLKRARRVRHLRGLAIGGGTAAVVALLLVTQVVLRPVAGPSLPPAQPGGPHSGVVYLRDATDEQRSAVRSTLDGYPGISKVRLVTKEEAYQRFAKMFGNPPDAAASPSLTDLPESFEFEASAGADRRDLLQRLRSLWGVVFAASPVPPQLPPSAPPPYEPAPPMGLPEAQVYSEQLLLLAQAVRQSPTPPKTVYLVDGFCLELQPGCSPQRFSPLLRSGLQSRLSGYAEVVFVEGQDQVDPARQDAIVVTLGPLAAHDIGGDRTLWLEAHNARFSEYAEFRVAWEGGRWVVGPWTGGRVSTAPQ